MLRLLRGTESRRSEKGCACARAIVGSPPPVMESAYLESVRCALALKNAGEVDAFAGVVGEAERLSDFA